MVGMTQTLAELKDLAGTGGIVACDSPKGDICSVAGLRFSLVGRLGWTQEGVKGFVDDAAMGRYLAAGYSFRSGENLLKALRKLAGLTQRDLAISVGTDPTTVSKWETGTQVPSAAKLRKLAVALGCTVGQLLGTEGMRANDSVRP